MRCETIRSRTNNCAACPTKELQVLYCRGMVRKDAVSAIRAKDTHAQLPHGRPGPAYICWSSATAHLLAGTQELSQRMDCGMHLGTLSSLDAIVARPAAALGRSLERAAVVHGSGGVSIPPLAQPQDGPQVMAHRLKHDGSDGSAGRAPARAEIMRQHPPGFAASGHVAQGFGDWFALRRVWIHQAQVQRDEIPLVVRHVGRVWLPARPQS